MAETMIEVRDLTKHYGAVEALSEVSFEVPRGQVVGLLGPNGAGKTTAMRILTGYVAPTGGTAFVDGQDVVEEPMGCRRRIGYLPEGNPLYLELRVEEALGFSAQMHGLTGDARRRAVSDSIEAAGLLGLERRLIGTFSKGYRQRVGLAQALLHQPDVLILDEPTSGLDPNQQEEMRSLIRSLGAERTVMLSTHILPEVEAVCDRALIISKGKLVADGSVEEIRATAASGPAAVVVVRAEKEAVKGAFEPLPFVKSIYVDALEGASGHLRVRLAVEDGDHREQLEAVAAAAHRGGLPLSELAAERATLEQIFAQLTADAPEDAPSATETPADAGNGEAEQ
ncbi:MAG: ABC transporter ATP-binding protein [Planctomycetota bacterium]|jgi:ABC-2 type transport system ATP-binding protein